MSNFEWLLENNKELIKDSLFIAFDKEKNEPKVCRCYDCKDCRFFEMFEGFSNCKEKLKKWLDAERELR